MTVAVIVSIAICILLSGFFSASEMAFSACSRVRIEHLAENGSRAASTALRVLNHFENALSAILIGNNLVNIAASSLGSLLAIRLAGEQYTWVSTLVLTVLVIILGETIPKILAERNATRFSLRLAAPVRFLMGLLYPVVFVTVRLVRFVTGLLKEEDAGEDMAAEELRTIIETAEDEEVLDEDTSELVSAAIDFSGVTAQEVMTARVDMVTIDLEDSPEKIQDVVENALVTRIPVYEGDLDHIIGVLHASHYLKAAAAKAEERDHSGAAVRTGEAAGEAAKAEERDDPGAAVQTGAAGESEGRALLDREEVRSLLMPAGFVYRAMKLPAVLTQLREKRQQIAAVTDEYGGIIGLVSVEDVLEELVGEIWDETDIVEQDIVEGDNGGFDVDGSMPLDDLAEFMGWREDELECRSETVGGWCIEMIGSFPEEGDSFAWKDAVFHVTKISERRVASVHVERKAAEASP